MAYNFNPGPARYGTYPGGFYTVSAATTSGSTYYADQYGYRTAGGGFVSDRETYYREMAQKLQEEVRHLQRMSLGSPYQLVDAPLAPAKPKEPDNIAWLRQRVAEITAEGKLAA